MNTNDFNIREQYEKLGAEFLSSESAIKDKLSLIKAFVFDWDGVFNNSEKNESGSSNFNEADSMGTNLLRFSFFCQHKHLPVTAIISGEHNKQSFFYAQREHYQHCYYKVNNKLIAFEHLCKTHGIKPKEVAYFFDDVLDLSIAKECGLRILINRKTGLLFKNHVRNHHLADYITASESGHNAVREACEVMMGLNNSFETVITKRTHFDSDYAKYIELRNNQPTHFFTLKEGKIEEAKEF